MSVWMFPKIGGKPPKWMVYNGKPYFLMDDLGVFPLFLETPVHLQSLHKSPSSNHMDTLVLLEVTISNHGYLS